MVESAALGERLKEVHPHLCGGEIASLAVGDLLDELSRSLWREPTSERVWLLLIATAGSFPLDSDVLALRRSLKNGSESQAMSAVLKVALWPAIRDGLFKSRIRIESTRPLVDVDFTARHGYNTGIQRVVRQTISRWNRDGHDFEIAAWTGGGSAMRALEDAETERVVAWHSELRSAAPDQSDPNDQVLIVPWHTTVIVPEVTPARVCAHLATLARFSGNRVVAIGYDAIPIASVEDIYLPDSNRFGDYLSMIKHVDRVLTISSSAAEEFSGFAEALGAQGLVGPEVTAVPLPVDSFPGTATVSLSEHDEAVPLIISVGTQEHRKNQVATLFAAEQLWREGLRFELLFVGGQAWPLSNDFDELFTRLKNRGRPLTLARDASDEFLLEAYERSRFSVFISLHEGFGLPVAESLAHGTPVLTSNHGSTAEVAALGGCVLVDPRDDVDILEGVRRMLTDDELIRDLRAQIAARPPRTWDQYAREVWAYSLEVSPS